MKLFIFCFLFSSAVWAEGLDGWVKTTVKNINTDVVLVFKDQQKIYEYYGRGYTLAQKHLSWSMVKTLTGLTMAMISEEYGVSLETPVSKYIPQFRGSARIIDLMQMSSGIEFSEEYFGLPVNADVVRMLYLDGEKLGAAGYVLTLPLYTEYKPSEYFYYSSGDTNLLSQVMRKIINDDAKYHNYLWEKILGPLGITDATAEIDVMGTFIGSSYLYMRPMDYVRLAQFVADGGKLNGKRLIPETYMKLLGEVAPGVNKQALLGTSPTRAYSVLASVNQPILGRGLGSEYADLPEDTILMIGHQGQLLAVSPSQNLIILRLATDKKNTFDRNTFFKKIHEEIKKHNLSLEVAKNTTTVTGEIPTSFRRTKSLTFSDLLKVPELIRNYTAKEFCSCYFVVKRTAEQCKEDISYTMPVMPRVHVEDQMIKTDFFIGDSAVATFLNDRLGCRLN